MKKILYFGWLGHKNIGDELMWEIFRDKFQEKFNSTEYKMIPSTKKIRNRLRIDNSYLKSFDIIILGGGSILMPTFINILFKAIQLRKDVEIYVWGSGIDWIERKDLNKYILNEGQKEALVRTEFNRFPQGWFQNKLQVVLNHCKFIGLRGHYTYRILKKKGVNLKNAVVTGDPGLLMEWETEKPEENRDSRLVAVNWGTALNRLYGKDERRLENQLVRVIEELVDKGYKFCIFPVWEKDVKPCIRLYNRLKTLKNVELITELYDQYQIMELFRKCLFSINLKLHATVLSAVTKTPFIAMGYRFKVFDFAHSVGLESFVISTDDPHFDNKTLKAVSEIEVNEGTLMSQIDMAQKQCERELEKIFQFF